MAQLTIDLTAEELAALEARARQEGRTVDHQLRAEMDELFSPRRARVQQLIRGVVRDHRELFERLA